MDLNSNQENNETENTEKKKRSHIDKMQAMRVYVFVTQILTTMVILPFLGYWIGSSIEKNPDSDQTAIWFMIGGLILSVILNILFIFQFMKNQKRNDANAKKNEHSK